MRDIGGELAWISIVDPDPDARDALRTLLGKLVADVRAYESAEEFLATLGCGMPACLICDVCLPDMSGLMLLRELRAMRRSVPTILLATDPDVATAVAAIREGALDLVEKPWRDARITQRVVAILSITA